MMLQPEISQLLKDIGPGRSISPSPYDTAWIARLMEVDRPLAEAALNWICTHQLPDGSWGASEIVYHHDRVICTLSAVTMLAQYGYHAGHKDQMKRGQTALKRMLGTATRSLNADPNGATVAFELLAPRLMDEASALGIVQHSDDRFLGRLGAMRRMKLSMLNGRLINRLMTAAHSIEMVGPESIDLLDLGNLQEANGSIGYSPAATSFYLLHVNPHDTAALSYLRNYCSAGAAPYVIPIDGFEVGWTLWNLELAGLLNSESKDEYWPPFEFLRHSWVEGIGLAAAIGVGFVDCDAAAIAYDVLMSQGYTPDIQALLRYEEADHFRCYDFEANPSVSNNIHVLNVLRRAGYKVEDPSVQKIVRFLRNTQVDTGFWLDKWHVSPYYPTAHLVIACMGFIDDMARLAVEWLLSTQRSDGAWGYYLPTAEETAYSLQALAVWNSHTHSVDKQVFRQGAAWLQEHAKPPYPSLWIGKSLYCPELVVRSAILSALAMAASA
jgi:halimadienyl-diphosphate synthase